MFREFVCALFVLAAILPGGCSSGDGGGTLRVHLTDAPARELRAVNVTVSSVRIHENAQAGENAAGWTDIPVTVSMPVDLVTLRGGVLMELCDTALDAGEYQQVRLVLAPNRDTSPPYRNFVVDANGMEQPLDVPTAGTKITHRFSVAEGMTTDLVLDFDADQSCNQRGDGTWFMEPWITADSTSP